MTPYANLTINKHKVDSKVGCHTNSGVTTVSDMTVFIAKKKKNSSSVSVNRHFFIPGLVL